MFIFKTSDPHENARTVIIRAGGCYVVTGNTSLNISHAVQKAGNGLFLMRWVMGGHERG